MLEHGAFAMRRSVHSLRCIAILRGRGAGIQFKVNLLYINLRPCR